MKIPNFPSRHQAGAVPFRLFISVHHQTFGNVGERQRHQNDSRAKPVLLQQQWGGLPNPARAGMAKSARGAEAGPRAQRASPWPSTERIGRGGTRQP